MKKLKFVVPTLVLGVLVLVGAGCGGGGEPGEDGQPVGENGGQQAEVPTSDVAGEDISDVPRYPGSVRINYSHLAGHPDIPAITYLTNSADIEAVYNFYLTQLPANGWHLSEVDTSSITHQIGALKEGRKALVYLMNSDDYPGSTEMLIYCGLMP